MRCNEPTGSGRAGSHRDAWQATVRYRRGVGILSERRSRHFGACAAALRLVTQTSRDRAAQMREIGRQLRLEYAEIVAEGVPERFAEILRTLDEPSAGAQEMGEGSKDEPTPRHKSVRADRGRS
jgi:Anti-sigma factor NepR